MKNFYHVATLQMSHPRVKKLTDTILNISENAIEMKVRSKPFVSFTEAISKAKADFSKKCKVLYGDGEHEIRQIVLINPSYTVSDELANAFSIDENKSWVNEWEEKCAATLFFTEHSEEETVPQQWMIKYEIYVFTDEIALNGEGAFGPEQVSQQYNSTIN